MPPPKIRFLFLSDTHDNYFPDPSNIPAADVVLHCGDMTMIGGLSDYKAAIKNLSACRAELKLVIPGNHDVSLDPVWWPRNLDGADDSEEPKKARAIFSLEGTGVHLLDEGLHTFILQNGRSFSMYASSYTPGFKDHAFGYGPEEDRFDPKATNSHSQKKYHPMPQDVDVVVTHGPSMVPHEAYALDKTRDGEHRGCSKLWSAIQRTRPRLHCFGHIHEGYGAQSVGWNGEGNSFDISDVMAGADVTLTAGNEGETLLVNASIMGHDNERTKNPVMAELELSRFQD